MISKIKEICSIGIVETQLQFLKQFIIYLMKKREVRNLSEICLMHFEAVLKSKLATFWHISEGTFYHKRVKFVGTFTLTIQNRLAFFVFQ